MTAPVGWLRAESLWRWPLFLLAALPALYVFLAIQYASVTVPFWDHSQLIRWIASWHAGDFHFLSLWAPHNHTRPLVYRFVMLFNAVLTDWDIRSEYVYVYLAIYATFACHVWALRRNTATDAARSLVYPIALLVVSLVLFSPVGHNNHWWSMMFQLDAANLFIVLALLMAFVRPHLWSSHLCAAISCWLATFTLTNGLFVALAVGIVFQLSATPLLRPSRWLLFWAGNLLALLVVYLPGIALSNGSSQPTLLEVVQFSLAYLGAPIWGLLRFPYANMFDVPHSVFASGLCGAMLVTSSALLSWHARERFRERHPAALILLGFTFFSLFSAVATGWGRAAFDENGVSNGNSSRYTIFGAYLILGQIHYISAGIAHGWWNSVGPGTHARRIAAACVMAFIALSFRTYGNGLGVYRDAHHFNKILISAYSWGLQPAQQDPSIYPNPDFVKQLKGELQRLEVGPYNNRQFDRQVLPVGEFRKVCLLSRGRQITQRFIAAKNGLKAVAVTLVTPNGLRTSGTVEWLVTEVGATHRVAHGTLDAGPSQDWKAVRLRLPYLADSKGREYQLALSAQTEDAHGAGVALYLPAAPSSVSVSVSESGGTAKVEGFSMALRLEYAK